MLSLFWSNSLCTELSQWLIENKLVEHLFGPNLHVEVILVKQRKSLLFLWMEKKRELDTESYVAHRYSLLELNVSCKPSFISLTRIIIFLGINVCPVISTSRQATSVNWASLPFPQNSWYYWTAIVNDASVISVLCDVIINFMFSAIFLFFYYVGNTFVEINWIQQLVKARLILLLKWLVSIFCSFLNSLRSYWIIWLGRRAWLPLTWTAFGLQHRYILHLQHSCWNPYISFVVLARFGPKHWLPQFNIVGMVFFLFCFPTDNRLILMILW